MQGMDDQLKTQNLVEMAKKRRHLALVEKLARGKASTPSLSSKEIRELAKFEGDPDSPGLVDSQEKVGKIFGVATRTVERWVKEGMPVSRDGRYDLIEIRAWRDFKNSKKKGEKKKTNWEDEYRKFKALTAQMAYEEKMGTLIPRAIVEKELISISMGIQRALLSLPRQVAPQLEGFDARKISSLLTERIKEAIKAISDGKILMSKIINAKEKSKPQNLDTEGQ